MRKRLLLSIVMLTTVLGVVTPNQASAATSFNLLKTSSFPASPPVGWHVCQSKYVTLPKLASTDRYAWGEDYPDGNGDAITNYSQTFYGTFYWTVCVFSMKGDPSTIYWTYKEYSLMTQSTSACTNYGHCTTYYLQNHYIRDTSGGSKVWGSQLFVRPASWCFISACENVASVSVTKT
jgi:hypothetical protein